jgi:hypothetical protein
MLWFKKLQILLVKKLILFQYNTLRRMVALGVHRNLMKKHCVSDWIKQDNTILFRALLPGFL